MINMYDSEKLALYDVGDTKHAVLQGETPLCLARAGLTLTKSNKKQTTTKSPTKTKRNTCTG